MGLNLALELLAAAVDLGEVIVGQFAPLLLHLTRELLPVALNTISVHRKPPVAAKRCGPPGGMGASAKDGEVAARSEGIPPSGIVLFLI